MSWNRLVNITTYFDQPRSGVAFMDGGLVAFECFMDEAGNDYTNAYGISPIDFDVLPLIEETESIFRRWSEAFHAGKTHIDTHPALPSDRSRYDQLSLILEAKLHIDENACERLCPDFKPETLDSSSGKLSEPENWRVKWNRS